MKAEDKDGSASGEKSKKGRLAFSVRFLEDLDTLDRYYVIFTKPYAPKDLDEDGLAHIRYHRNLKETLGLNKEAREDYLKKRFGREEVVKGHPKRWAVDEFVRIVQVLKVEKAPGARKWWRKDKERYRDELLEYLGEALENLDWKGLKGLGRIFEMAVTGEGGRPLEVSDSDLVKAHQLMEIYDHLKVAGIIAEGDFQPDENGVIHLPVELAVIPDPTRMDLEELLPESDRRRIKQICRAVKALGYKIKPIKPGPPPL